MNRYEGLPCTCCKEKFTKDSDVVVCPYCGAPYHRECYKKLGKCAFEDKHKEGYTWEIPVEDLPPERITICMNCKTPNPKENIYCSKCHAKLSNDIKVVSVIKEPADENDTLTPDGEVLTGEGKGISAAEVSAYVGNNAYYFLKRFRLMANGKNGFSWNWPAFFFKFFYFFYRRMYSVGFILMIVSMLLAAPSVIFTREMMKMQALELFGVELAYNENIINGLLPFIPTINILNILYSVFCGVYANKAYMKKTFSDIRKVKGIVMGKVDVKKYLDELRRVGKPDRLTVVLIALLMFMSYMKIGTDFANLLL